MKLKNALLKKLYFHTIYRRGNYLKFSKKVGWFHINLRKQNIYIAVFRFNVHISGGITMKKIIAILFILLIGLMILGGCSNTHTNESKHQQENTTGQNLDHQGNAGMNTSNDTLPKPPAFPKGGV